MLARLDITMRGRHDGDRWTRAQEELRKATYMYDGEVEVGPPGERGRRGTEGRGSGCGYSRTKVFL